jgi:tRNA-guanine family transglycosylase
VVDIQSDFGSDIMMMLDVCSPVDNITKQEVEAQMNITHKRAKQAYQHFDKLYEDTR